MTQPSEVRVKTSTAVSFLVTMYALALFTGVLLCGCGDNIPAEPRCDPAALFGVEACNADDPTGEYLCSARPPAEGRVFGCVLDISDNVPGATRVECVAKCAMRRCRAGTVNTATTCPGRADVRCVGFGGDIISGCWIEGESTPGVRYAAFCTADTEWCGR